MRAAPELDEQPRHGRRRKGQPAGAPAPRAPAGARAGSVAVLGALLLATAAVFDAEPLHVAGLALLLLAAASVLWVTAVARGLRARRSLAALRIVEGEELEVSLDVRCGRLPLPCGRVLDGSLGIDEPLPAGRSAARVRTRVRVARRGRLALGPVHVAVRDPLGLAGRTVEVAGGGEEVLVLPAVHPLHGGREGAWGQRRRARAQPAATAFAATDVDGVAGLRAGTPASRVFWPSIAGGREPLERRLVADGDDRPLVVLDLDGAHAEPADAAVRATASLAVALGRAGGCSVLLPGDRRPTDLGVGLVGWPHLHARLAVAAGAPRPGAAAGQRGRIVYVCARPVQRSPRMLEVAPSGSRDLLVLAGTPPGGAPPGARALFTIAGCTVHEISPRRAVPGRARREARA